MRQIEKHSSIANKIPSVNVLADGEMALNTNDSKIFIKRSDGVLVEHNEWEPKLYEVQDLAARDALTPKNGQYAFYADGGDVLDMWYEGSWVLIQKTPPPPPRFLMRVLSPDVPVYDFGNLSTTTVNMIDEGGGSYLFISNDKVEKIESIGKNETSVHIIHAKDLTDCRAAWHSCKSITSFNTEGMTSVTLADNAWTLCIELTSFNASGLTSVTNIRSSWSSCSKLTSIDVSNSISISFARFAFTNCEKLTSFDTSSFTNVGNIERAWDGCTALTSFDASGLTSVIDAENSWRGCPFTPNPPLNPSTNDYVWP